VPSDFFRRPTAAFAQLVQGPEDQIALDEGALLIAATARPSVDVPAALAHLDELAARCPAPTLDGLRHQLYVVEGFRGNAEDYYDPANSYLDVVLDQRRGIPITLAIVLMEVGRRVGVTIEGVNAPGHFLVRHHDALLDPFAGAAVVEPTGLPDAALEVVGPRLVLARMLGNLKAIFLNTGDVGALRWVLELRTAIPGVPESEREELRRLMAQLN
jgi:regulator of sirC expression with transglutaminase-like and TPR domain